MSSMLSAPATIPATSEVDLQPGVRALVRRHRQVLIGQLLQPGRLGQRDHRDQPGRRHADSDHRTPPTVAGRV